MSDSKVVKRSVSFNYYQVIINNGLSTKLFDLTEWMDKIQQIDLVDRGTAILTDVIRYDYGRADFKGEKKISILHFTKLRKNEVPGVARVQYPELTDVTLDEDEFIAEDVSCLFDSENCVLMLQKNVYSLSLSAVESYLNYFWNKDRYKGTEENIELRPIFEKDVFKKSKSKNKYKAISFKTANAASINCMSFIGGTLGELVDSIKYIGGISIEVKVSAGRKSHDELDREKIRELIENIESNQDEFRSAAITSKDGMKSEMIELLENKVKSVYDFSIEPKTMLQAEQIQDKIFREYMNNMRKYIVSCLEG